MTACRECGHPKADHTKTTGPNSIGRRWHHGCAHGASEVPWGDVIALIGGCDCLTYVPPTRWQRMLARITRGGAR